MKMGAGIILVPTEYVTNDGLLIRSPWKFHCSVVSRFEQVVGVSTPLATNIILADGGSVVATIPSADFEALYVAAMKEWKNA